MNMLANIENKILKSKGSYEIENKEEFSFILGQVIKYLKMQSESDDVSLQIIRNYFSLIKTEKIFKLLNNDFNRYAYKIRINSRVTVLYTGLLNYMQNNKVEEVDYINYKIGLLSYNNVMFIKKEEIVENE